MVRCQSISPITGRLMAGQWRRVGGGVVGVMGVGQLFGAGNEREGVQD